MLHKKERLSHALCRLPKERQAAHAQGLALFPCLRAAFPEIRQPDGDISGDRRVRRWLVADVAAILRAIGNNNRYRYR